VQIEVVLTLLAAFVISFALTGVIRQLALAHGMLDVPNARSSHVTPTPRGGGVAIVVAATAAAIAFAFTGNLQLPTLAIFVIGGTAVALVGFFDDRIRLSARVRLAVHFAAAAAAMYWVGGLPPMQVGERLVTFGWEGYLLGILGIVWSLNLFNFMDGIDGIAASQGMFMTVGGATLAIAMGSSTGFAPLALGVGGACLGFLLWNWPPAKIFMGDAGSGYVGYTLAVLALLAGRENSAGLFAWLILGGVFFVDATLTLARRVARRERVYEAHRSHAYQWLSRRWNSHRRVTLLTVAVNVLWLFPCAFLAVRHPTKAAVIAVLALIPIGLGAIAAGAGRKES
jgi:Fuc2NAc and GlcNAc transferase